MSGAYRHYGWECSPYSSKTRSYLRFKGIEHQDIYPTIIDFKRVIVKRLGYLVMPMVITPDDETLQDSSVIIDYLEERFPEPSIHPPGPTQRLASLLIELNADEWLPIIAMHTRWNDPQNSRFADKEFGANALPWMPRFTHSYLGHHLAGLKMRSYRKVFGITPDTQPAIDLWLEELLDCLSEHFETYPFLLGSRPCIGDFALYGPLYAHVMRDPGSSHWVNRRPLVRAWIDRLREPSAEVGDFVDNDEVPSTLDPLFRRMFREQFPILEQTVERVSSWLEEHPNASKLPRGLGEGEFTLGGVSGQRQIMTFQQWMLQRPLDYYKGLPEPDREQTNHFLRKVGGLNAMQTHIPNRLTLRNFRIIPELTT
jgi:glutathione S-transferase